MTKRGIVFRSRRNFARLAWRWRRMQRSYRNFPVVWRTMSALVAEDVALLREVEGDSVVGEDLLNRLVAARDAVITTTRRWSVISAILTFYLLTSSYAIDLHLTVEGISLRETPGLREILILVIAIIGVSLLPRVLNIHRLNGAISGLANLVFPTQLQQIVRSALFPAEPPSLYATTMQPHLIWSPPLIGFARLTGLFWLLFSLAAAAAIVWMRVTIYMHAWSNPTISPQLTHIIVSLASAIDLAIVVVQLSHIVPVPIRDWKRLHELDLAGQDSIAIYQRLSAALYEDDIADVQRMRASGYLEPDEH